MIPKVEAFVSLLFDVPLEKIKAIALVLWCLLCLVHAEHVTLTAVLSDQDGSLRFECWEMEPSFSNYPTVGKAVSAFADVSNVSWVVLPPQSTEGFHKPPHPMFAGL